MIPPNSHTPDSHLANNGGGHSKPHKGLLALSLGALGVVYGDIGTSPLYALDIMFFGHKGIPLTPDNILGGISLVIWSLTIIIAIKYAIFVLRADNDGEGGVFALYALLLKFKHRGKFILLGLLLLGAGLLVGDGIITPAISVLSAVEGIAVATPLFGSASIPLTIILLTVLFVFQYKGTGKVGSIFGPILMVWFVVIAYLGALQIIEHPEILKAFNPLYGISFLSQSDVRSGLLVLGALMLVLTGGEAMYAVMGHFGANPIRLTWFALVYPCLLLNYLGQGAFLFKGIARHGDNLFYSLVPSGWLYPMVVLATISTIIASQALISGAFSLTAQSIALGLFPRLRVTHTHHAKMGEVYVPFTNWVLYIGCILLVLIFGSSTALGSAYGLAVAGDMLITTLAMFPIALYLWKWNILETTALFGSIAIINFLFLMANSLKFWEGGFVPLTIGVVVYIIMVTWRWGRKITYAGYSAKPTMPMKDLVQRHREATSYIERTAILMVPAPVHATSERTPTLLQLLWDRNGLLPRNLIFVQVVHPDVPYISDNRYCVWVLEKSDKGSIVRVEIRFGFMEDPNVENVLKEMVSCHGINLSTDNHQWIVHVANEHLIPSRTMSSLSRVRLALFNVLRYISRPAYYHYGLGDEVQLSSEILPIHVR